MTKQPQGKFLTAGLLVAIGIAGYYMLTAPDRRSPGDKIGDAINELGDRTPGERLTDAIKK
jgi:hypothetical protein